jgi:hypothetical protein
LKDFPTSWYSSEDEVRIAFLHRWKYMSNDVIVDRHARLYEFPARLGRRGRDTRRFRLNRRGCEGNERSVFFQDSST